LGKKFEGEVEVSEVFARFDTLKVRHSACKGADKSTLRLFNLNFAVPIHQ